MHRQLVAQRRWRVAHNAQVSGSFICRRLSKLTSLTFRFSRITLFQGVLRDVWRSTPVTPQASSILYHSAPLLCLPTAACRTWSSSRLGACNLLTFFKYVSSVSRSIYFHCRAVLSLCYPVHEHSISNSYNLEPMKGFILFHCRMLLINTISKGNCRTISQKSIIGEH